MLVDMNRAYREFERNVRFAEDETQQLEKALRDVWEKKKQKGVFALYEKYKELENMAKKLPKEVRPGVNTYERITRRITRAALDASEVLDHVQNLIWTFKQYKGNEIDESILEKAARELENKLNGKKILLNEIAAIVKPTTKLRDQSYVSPQYVNMRLQQMNTAEGGCNSEIWGAYKALTDKRLS